jgi:flagellar hook-associated protein 2
VAGGDEVAAISFSGLASGIDGDAIIKNFAETRRLTIAPLEKQIEENKKENEAIEELNTKLLAFRDTIKDFMTLSGSAITKNGISSDDSIVGASVNSSALATSTSLTVENLARSAVFSFADRFTNLTTPIAPGLAGNANVTMTVGRDAAAKTITAPVTSTTTLADLADSINTQAGGALAASVVNVGSDSAPQYILVINGMKPGLAEGELTVSVDPAITGQGIFANSTISQAEDALFTITGIGQISRPSNQITGVIPGVTLELKAESATPVTISVTDNRDKTAEKFDKLIGTFNELLTYINDNNKVERVEQDGKVTNVYSPLAKTRIDNQMVTAIKNALGDSISENGTAVRVFADMGVSTERDGSLKLDIQKFTDALARDPNGANELLHSFGDKLGTADGVIDNFTKFQGQFDISKDANDSEIDTLQERIDRVEQSIEKQSATLKLIYANLETKVSRLTAASNALSGIIAGGFGSGGNG